MVCPTLNWLAGSLAVRWVGVPAMAGFHSAQDAQSTVGGTRHAGAPPLQTNVSINQPSNRW
jgi:hypothetical protein